VRHFGGVGPDEVRTAYIEDLTIAPGPRRVRVRAVDITEYLAELLSAVGPTARIGRARIGWMRIGYAGMPATEE
jgi:hypothetical protein